MTESRICPGCDELLPGDLPPEACPICGLAEVPPASAAGHGAPFAEPLGQRIGRYRLIEKLGEGGHGAVYRAQQEEGLRREVALKVIKLGMDTRQVVARFEAERQTLTLMEHPNIARVIDAGATEAGRPFFVMELVCGRRITDYCDQQKLPTSKRLNLFVQVCQAVQHAHQKGIIHRDLKPSNVLVAQRDGEPIPKVIDFGIAKATQQARTDETLLTPSQQFLGTPAYMSPEQAGLGPDIDTRSDIYSLGVLLYELVTGHLPFEGKNLPEANPDEMRRWIREREPSKPSTRLGTLTPEESTTVAERRQTEPPRLIRLVRGDLDWIVMKCLEKDRARRYESANGLAVDIQRHLHSEPVLARPASGLYRFQRLVSRNKLAFGAAVAIAAVLVLGIVFSSWQAIRATRAERQQARLRQRAEAAETTAKAEANKSGQVARFLRDLLESVGPSVARGRNTAIVREVLDKTAERVGKDLKAQPDVEAELRGTIGNFYAQISAFPQAGTMHTQALALRISCFGEKHAKVADSLNDLAVVLRAQGKLGEAEIMWRKALALREELLGQDHPQVASSLNNLGAVLLDQGKLSEAEPVFRRVLSVRRKLLGDEHVDVATSILNLANVLVNLSRLPEAEEMTRAAVALRTKLLGDPHPDLATSLCNLGTVLWYESRFAEAETVYRQTLAMQHKLLGDEHVDVATSLHNLACLLQSQGKFLHAESLCRQALAMRRKLLGNEHFEVAASLSALSTSLLSQGRFGEAEAAQREALALQRKLQSIDPQDIAVSLNNLADVLRATGRSAEAETTQREALEKFTKLLGTEHQLVAQALNTLGNILLDANRLPEAEEFLRQALAQREKLLGKEHSDTAQSYHDVFTLLRAQGKPAEAEPLLRDALVIRRKLLGNEHPDTIDSLYELAALLRGAGKFTEAENLSRDCLDACSKRVPEDWRTPAARSLLGSIFALDKNYAEAEPLLLSGFDGLKQQQTQTPANRRPLLRDTADRLAQLYQATSRPNEAARWKTNL